MISIRRTRCGANICHLVALLALAESKLLHEEGVCKVKLTVTADGTVRDVSLTKSTGYPRLDQACSEAFVHGGLLSATRNGQPITTTLEIPITKNPSGALEGVDRFSAQDESLFGFSVAMNGNNLAEAVEEIERAGCVRGVDFVVTSHFEGVLDEPLPNWLSVEQRPVTFTPEQLSTMIPKLREVVERQAPRMASFYTYIPSGA